MIYLAILIIVGVILYLALRKKKGTPTEYINGVAVSRKTIQTTPKGVTVYSETGIPESSFTVIDGSLTQLFSDARNDGYTRSMMHNKYDVFIPYFECTPSPEAHVYSFRVRGDNYDGTVWDQNPAPGIGEVLCGEMVLNLGTQGSSLERCQMVCCPQIEGLGVAVRYGAEHCILAADETRQDRFTLSQTHSGVYGHPLIGWNNRDAN